MRVSVLMAVLLPVFFWSDVVDSKTTGPKKSPREVQRKDRPKGGEQWFLSHREFLQLSRADQKKYLRDVKKALGSLSQMSHTFATLPSSSKRSPASEPQYLASGVARFIDQAERWRGEPPMLVEYTVESRQAEFLEKWQNSMWWVVASRIAIERVPDSDPEKAAVLKRIEEMERFYLSARRVAKTSFAKTGQLDRAYDSLTKAKAKEINHHTPNVIPSGALISVDDRQPLNFQRSTATSDTTPATTSQTTPQVVTSGSTNREEEPAAERPPPRVIDISGTRPTTQEVATAETPVTEPEEPVAESASAPAAEELPTLQGYRCMYAGFIIRQDPCRGPQALPEDVGLTFLESSRLTCAEGQVLCNPLLFGLKLSCALGPNQTKANELTCLKTGQPVCVARGKFATRDCGTQSDNESHLNVATALIRQSPEAWNRYIWSFYELCDQKMIVMNDFVHTRNGEPRPVPEATRADVEQTCARARTQLEKISNHFRAESGRELPQGTPSGTATDGQQ